MDRCVVIQPFDSGIYDKRFEDTFKPAIDAAGLEAYRVDMDDGVTIPIETIEQNIRECSICFAEITTDNPNVWYELGFAFACGKPVIMVCSEDRGGKFPFDIQHRYVIKYKTQSMSDFANLQKQITAKINAVKNNLQTVQKIHTTMLIETEGLKPHEIAILTLILGGQFTPEDGMSMYSLQQEMERGGYTMQATGLGVRNLRRLNMIETSIESDPNGDYAVCRLADKGESWLLENQHSIKLTQENDTEENGIIDPDDLPF